MKAALFLKRCCYPVYAEMLAHRAVALSIAGFGAAQLLGSSFGVGLPCAFHKMTGMPCPGCGLTRSVLALLHGNMTDSIGYHPFGPLLLLGLLTALAAGSLPAGNKMRLLKWVSTFESHTGFTAIALGLLVVTWGLRVCGMLPLKAI
ncbi:MAG TPA: DUF2752 domain-containing protein [Phycisphaerae bacterium]|jgi:hypothetical protein